MLFVRSAGAVPVLTGSIPLTDKVFPADSAIVISKTSLEPFTAQAGSPSVEQSIEVSAPLFNTEVRIQAPDGFELYTDGYPGQNPRTYGVATQLGILGASSIPGMYAIQVHVRLMATGVAGTRSGNMVITGGGLTKTIPLTGTITGTVGITDYPDTIVTSLVKQTAANFFIRNNTTSVISTTYSISAGSRAMPGFTPVTNGTLGFIAGGKGGGQAGFYGAINIPANTPAGRYDFNVTLGAYNNTAQSTVYHVTLCVMALTSVTPIAAMHTTPNVESPYQAFHVTVKGLPPTLASQAGPYSAAGSVLFNSGGIFKLKTSVNGSPSGSAILPTDNNGTLDATLYIGLQAPNLGTFKGPITVESIGTGFALPIDTIAVPPGVVGLSDAPTQVSYHLTFANTTGYSTYVKWTKGNGARQMVFVAKATNGVAAPVDGTAYQAGASFGSGSQIGATGWYCVYDGTGDNALIQGLTAGTYRVAVVDCNFIGQPDNYDYQPTYIKTGVAPANIAIGATQASYGLTFTNVADHGFIASWTNGNGAARMVFVARTSVGVATPNPGVYMYAPNTAFGQGDQIDATGWYCVYNGTGSSVNVTGLDPSATYRVTVIDYNRDPAANPQYVSTGLSPANVTTTVAGGSAAGSPYITFSNTTGNSTGISWSNSSGAKRVVFIAATNNGVAPAVNSTTYAANTQMGHGSNAGGWYCVYNGTGSGVNVTGLTGNTLYRVCVLGYTGASSSEVYESVNINPAFLTTPNDVTAAPNLAATHLNFTNTTATGTTINWTNGSGTKRAVFVAQTNNSYAMPVNATTYSANAQWQAGTQVGNSGWYCVYNGTGSSVAITGLSGSTTYRVTVIEYNGSASAEKYTVTGLSPATVTTAVDAAVTPTLASYHLTFDNTTTNSTTVSWTNGNGSKRAVFIAQTNNGYATPVNGIIYMDNSQFGLGNQVGTTGWYCIYNGNASSANITGLTAGTTYRITVVDYNGVTGAELYQSTGLAPQSFKTVSSGSGITSLSRLSVNNIASADTKTVEVTNILSPNNDGKNDIWVVKNIEYYPNNHVTVYDGAGKTVYTQSNYANDWTGTGANGILTQGLYYYLIDLGNGKTVKGFITLMR